MTRALYPAVAIAIYLLSVAGALGATVRVPEDQPTIQAGLNAAAAGDVVLVGPGTYSEAITIPFRQLTLRSAAGPATTILTRSTGRSITMSALSLTVDGFTLTRTGTGSAGGIAHQSGDLTMTNCVLSGCSASFSGPGSGGAVAISSGSNTTCTFIGCTFSDNQASSNGGAIEVGAFAIVRIINCTFLRNAATFNGGALDAPTGTVSIVNSLFSGNSASTGGAVYSSGGSGGTRISGCTFVGNSGMGGTGRAVYSTSGTTFENSIVWATAGAPGIPAVYLAGSTATYCNIEGGISPGFAILNVDPMFVNAAAGDFRLASGSPCLDAGNSTAAIISQGAFDLDGRARLIDDAGAPNTGISYFTGAAVDMGCYERQPAPPIPTCPADFNHSGTLTVEDIFDYLSAWFAGCP